jgi:hypothetical protein
MKNRICLIIVLVCACLLQAGAFTLVVHRASPPTIKVAPVAAASLPTPSSPTNSAVRLPLKIFTTSVASVAALFFGALSALLLSLMNFDKLLQDHQEIKNIVKRREEIAKSSLEALDEIDIMLTESIQTCKDMNKYAEAAVKHKAMWSAFWRNLAIEVVVLTGATWAYLAHVLHHTQ